MEWEKSLGGEEAVSQRARHEKQKILGQPRFRAVLTFLFCAWMPAEAPEAWARDFVVDASSEVEFAVGRARDDLRLFDHPEFIARNLPGITGIHRVEEGVDRWDLKIRVPLSRPMQGSFLARRIVVNDNFHRFESLDPEGEDYMKCEISVSPASERETSIKIAIQLRFTRSNGFKFHWLAPLLGEKFLSARVSEKLGRMLAEFVRNSRTQWEGSG